MLKNIDFSKSIQSGPINDNFNTLDKDIKNERLATGGYGISYGLESSIKDLTVSFKKGQVVIKDGSSIPIDEVELTLDPPELVSVSETVIVMEDGTLFLKQSPYTEKGVSVTNLDDIRIEFGTIIVKARSIYKNKLTVHTDYAGKALTVFYQHALPRIDSIFIDANQKLSILKGTSSFSPSVRPTNDFVVLTLKINPYHFFDSYYTCGALKSNEFMNYRNLYTDSNNDLFMYGQPFSSLGIIHFTKPESPQENMVWLDSLTNKFYIYRSKEWQVVSDEAKTNVAEYKIFTPSENPTNLQTFFFHATEDLNMRFIPNKNELEIVIAQYPLFKDQYEEITYEMALSNPSYHEMLIEKGYDILYDTANQALYENRGIGFKLSSPLDISDYVQAKVTHRVVDASFQTRHQRSATFIKKGFVEIQKGDTTFTLDVPYRADECQLDLYFEDKTILFEHMDYEEEEAPRGTLVSSVTLTRPSLKKQKIYYRITSNVYSYDHISTLLENYGKELVPDESTYNHMDL